MYEWIGIPRSVIKLIKELMRKSKTRRQVDGYSYCDSYSPVGFSYQRNTSMYTTPTIINNNNNSNNNKLEYDELDYDGHFFRFGPKILWANLVQKNPNCLIKMKFAT